MIRSTEQSHVRTLIPEYVLGLLPGEQANWVAAHTAHCADCRLALAREQEIGRSVKTTLARVGTADSDRLRRLMPPAPDRNRLARPRLSPGLAAAGIMLLILFSTISLFAVQRPGAWSLTAPTAHSTTVMLTDTPTQTATREMTATVEGVGAVSSPSPAARSAAAGPAIAPAPALVPVPAAPMLQ